MLIHLRCSAEVDVADLAIKAVLTVVRVLTLLWWMLITGLTNIKRTVFVAILIVTATLIRPRGIVRIRYIGVALSCS
jgi:hypothetical protein